MLRRKDVDHILMTMLNSHKGVSDLLVTTKKPFQVESNGALVPVKFEPDISALTPYQTEMLSLGLLQGDPRNTDILTRTGSCDCAYQVPGESRFRINIFQQRKDYSIVLRKLSSHIMSIDELGLPDIFKTMAKESNGLILITGSTGSGKSTTLAALLNEMNETRPIHILTLEDPIEFVHPVKKATFNQRELGTDYDSFATGLRAALRQAPKVILVGEMRDRETVDIGLAAASTGHLVVSTLHSIDCGQTINRIVGMFEQEEEDQIRGRLVECLRYVVNQRLLRKKGGGRVAAQEIMGVNLRIKEILLKGESKGKTFYEIIGLNRSLGWQNYDQIMAELFEQDKITAESAMANASKRAVLAQMLDRIKTKKGIASKDDIKLSMDQRAGEAKGLIDKYWPEAGSRFPINKMTTYLTVNIEAPTDLPRPGTEVQMQFTVKDTYKPRFGAERTIEATGTLHLTGKNESNTQQVNRLNSIEVKKVTFPDESSIAQSRQSNYIEFIGKMLPEQMEFRTSEANYLSKEKKEALETLSKIGDPLVAERLRSNLQFLTDEVDQKLIKQAIVKIYGG